MEEPEQPPRRRGRTAALLAAAVALGVVAGTCVGYLVQADREPTALPPLSQPVLTQAKGPAPEPLSVLGDHKLLADGDLTRLLLPKPPTAKETDWLPAKGSWVDAATFASYYGSPGSAFEWLLDDEFRRAATVGWDTGTHTVEIRLVQYRQRESAAAADAVRNAQDYIDQVPDTDSWPIPGTGNGWAYVHNRPQSEPGSAPRYMARAEAWRGDIEMEIWVSGDRPVPKKTIMDVAERQMERL
ncbi:hypothetical protein ABZZ79_12460 [Streptomyces sp. NPDC006458]|uniref:hypothetical protein n=1 Tax=Streptomyces sp. NPDC006458 TaxID=3154302 RepID=UPI0033AA2FD5